MTDDLISRKAALDALEEYLDYLQMLNKKDNPTAEYKWYGVNLARNTIAELPPTQTEQQWIPVTEWLPEPNKKENDCIVYYLVQNEYGDMMVAAYRGNANGETWWEQMYAHKPSQDEVVAWMPLPEPWKGDK